MSTQATELSRNMQAFDHLREAIYVLDPAGSSIIACNLAASRQLLRSQEQLCASDLFHLRGESYDDSTWRNILLQLDQQSLLVFHQWHVRSNRQAFPVEETLHRVHWDNNNYLLCSVRDLSSRSTRQEEVDDREPLLSFILTEATDGMWDWNVTTGNVFYSMPLKRMLGFGPYEIEHTLISWQDSIHPEDRERVERLLEQYMSGDTDRYNLEYRLATRNGGYLWIHDRGLVTSRDANGQATRVVGMVQNINARKVMEEQLLRMATTDELTGLLNRRAGYVAFERALASSAAQSTPLSIALLDLDYFKSINDQFGHTVGDHALSLAARVFSNSVRPDDVLMRWGGEEFLLVMPATAHDDALRLVNNLRSQLEQTPLQLSGIAHTLTVSGGVASCCAGSCSARKLVHLADVALYRAKSAGRNRIVSDQAEADGTGG